MSKINCLETDESNSTNLFLNRKKRAIICIQGLCEDYSLCFKEIKTKFANLGYKTLCLRNIGNPEVDFKDSIIPHSLITPIPVRAKIISKLIEEFFIRYNPNTCFSLISSSQGGLTGTCLEFENIKNPLLFSCHYICPPFNGISYFNSGALRSLGKLRPELEIMNWIFLPIIKFKIFYNHIN